MTELEPRRGCFTKAGKESDTKSVENFQSQGKLRKVAAPWD
jgi:hypothetical protein